MGLGELGAVTMPRWVPNALSLLRIGLVPAWLALATAERMRAVDGLAVRRFWVVGLLVLVGLTDFLDGQLARRLHLATRAGALLDAVADKLATFTAVTFLTFFGAPAFTPLPVELWAVLIGRDLLLGTGAITLWLRHRRVDFEHRWHGRVATALLFLTVLLSCAAAPPALVYLLAAAVGALAIAGTADYLWAGLKVMRS